MEPKYFNLIIKLDLSKSIKGSDAYRSNQKSVIQKNQEVAMQSFQGINLFEYENTGQSLNQF